MDVGDQPNQPVTVEAVSQYCARVPALPKALQARQVVDFGAVPDDDRDDTDAIQRALDAMQPGQTLIFAPGRYLISRSLSVRRPGVTILGPNATIHATNPDDQSLLIQADNTTVASLTFTAVTQDRRTAPRHHRISVIKEDSTGVHAVYNTVIRDNRIVNAGEPGSPTANSASGGGIFLKRADGFLVSGNTVVRSLADGIHVTDGSRNGRILNNIVRETGDDMIAIVSYLGTKNPADNTASRIIASWSARLESSLVRNVLVNGNQVSGQYWGRGISVVGGQSITISRNTIDNVPLAAGILIAREASWQTFGVENVLVDGNHIHDVQTRRPPYDYKSTFSSTSRTGHGAIEVHAALFEDEAANSDLREKLAVRNVLLRGNVVDGASVSGVRAGVDQTRTLRKVDASGEQVQRNSVTGQIRNVGVTNNRFNQTTGEAIRMASTETGSAAYCGGNQRDGNTYQPSACKLPAPPATQGATLNCSSDGKLL